jgi:sigma-B regulation protein RsbU (phosphoserine phosphatase)
MHLSLRWKLILMICLPLIAVSACLLAWDYARQRDQAVLVMTDLVADRARQSADQIDARLSGVVQLADNTAANFSSRLMQEPTARLQIPSAFRLNPLISFYAIVVTPVDPRSPVIGAAVKRTAQGPRAVALSEIRTALEPELNKAWPTEGSAKAMWIGPLRSAALGSGTQYIYIAPMNVSEGERVRGVVAVAVRAEDIQGLLSGGVRPARASGAARERAAAEWSMSSPFGPDGFVVLDSQMQVVSHPEEQFVGTNLMAEAGQMPGGEKVVEALRRCVNSPPGAVDVPGLSDVLPVLTKDRAHWLAHAPIVGTGWTFITAIPQSAVLDPIVSEVRHRAAMMLSGIVLMAAAVAVFSLRISRPIEKLARAVDRVSRGDLRSKVEDIRGGDEIARLGHGFNDMVSTLDSQIRALAKETAARENIESELRIARKIQTDLLPSTFPPFPDRREFDLHAVNVAAQRVAGDFFDFFFVGDELVLVIADVSGKGVPAALLMAVTRTVVRNFASIGLSPREIVLRVNAILLADSADNMFVTMVLAKYDPRTGKLVYVNAGHPHPLVIGQVDEEAGGRKVAKVEELQPPDAPLLGALGEGEMGKVGQSEITLQCGQTLLLYTDGVTEARLPHGELFGDRRLRDGVMKLGVSDARTLCTGIVAMVDEYQGSHPADDITVLAIRRCE